MVLLTQSTVSVIISSGIVCSFTFLLFLSGYVLQQRTVRSLQDVIRNPPPKPYVPVPTLPPQFQKENNSLADLQGLNEQRFVDIKLDDGQQSILGVDAAQLAAGLSNARGDASSSSQISIRQLWNAYIDQSIIQKTMITDLEQLQKTESLSQSDRDTVKEASRLAYLLVLPTLSDICSALLFTNHLRSYHQSSSPPSPPISIVLIYPATWDTHHDPSHISAMSLLRSHHDTHHHPDSPSTVVNLIYHPVSISRAWGGVSIESQLMSEVQRTRWPYDRAMYLRTPGLTVSAAGLDEVLVDAAAWNVTAIETERKTKTKKRAKRKAGGRSQDPWVRMDSKNTGDRPDMLMYFDGEGLWVPSQGRGGVVQLGEISLSESDARGAGYVIFSNDELVERRDARPSFQDDKGSKDEIYAVFERGRGDICAGTDLLSS